MGQGTKAALVGNRRSRNINNFQGPWVCKSRIRVSVPVSHVTHIWRTHLQHCWGSCAPPVPTLVSAGQLSARPKSSAADPRPCQHPLILPWRVSLSKKKAMAIQKPGLQPGLWSNTRDRREAVGLSLHCLVIWVWGTGEDLQREEQTIASYQVRKAWLLYKYLAIRAWNGKYS